MNICRKYTDYTNSYSVPATTYHYDPLPPPPPPFPTTDPAQTGHSPAHWSPASSEHHPSLSTVSHSMSSYYSHPAFLPHARDIREAQVGMQVSREERRVVRADCVVSEISRLPDITAEYGGATHDPRHPPGWVPGQRPHSTLAVPARTPHGQILSAVHLLDGRRLGVQADGPRRGKYCD